MEGGCRWKGVLVEGVGGGGCEGMECRGMRCGLKAWWCTKMQRERGWMRGGRWVEGGYQYQVNGSI